MVKSRGLPISRDTLLYIAGAITPTEACPNQRANEDAAMLVGVRWFKRGYSVYVPALNTRGFECFGVKYEEFMEHGFAVLRKCQGLVLMDNWVYSAGAQREYDRATSLGLVIFEDRYFSKYFGGNDGKG